MPLSVQLGLLLALGCAFVSILGFLYKQRGAQGAPPVEWRHPVRSTVALFANKWWTLGIVVAIGGWVLHVAALALAPISLVQSVIAGGLAMLTVVAEKLFGFSVSKREWIGVALTAAGLAFLAATLGDTGSSAHGEYTTGGLLTYCLLLIGIAVACCVAVLGDPPRTGPVLAVAAGLLWGASDVAIKAQTGAIGDGLIGAIIDPLALFITVVSLAGLVVSARSLQIGDAVPVIALTSAAANVSTIASGPIVFGEPMPEEPFQLALRILAFALVCFAAWLTPGPQDPVTRPASA